MNYPYMPKSTALWLIENTSLTFEQIAEFCGLHELEVKNIADAETAKIQGLNPVLNGQLTRENISECEQNPNARLILRDIIVQTQNKQNKRGVGYTPKLHRQARFGSIIWILENYPELSNAQVAHLIHSTSPTVKSIREKTHKAFSENSVSEIKKLTQNPIVLGLVSKSALEDANFKATKHIEK